MIKSFQKIITISNSISFFRVLLGIPIFILLDNFDNSLSVRTYLILLLLFAYVTDISDGYIARKRNEITEAGKFIDPLADKILVAIIIIKLLLIGEIPEYYFWIIILRDVIIFIGGIIVSRIIKRVLPSNLLGKITVLSIGIFLIITILNTENSGTIYLIFMYLSILLSFASLIGYGIRAVESIKWYKKNETI